jgi:hypothetical protein
MRTGRPKKPAGEARNLVVVVRVNTKEKQELQAAADIAAHGDLSTWARNLMLGEARRCKEQVGVEPE